MKHINYSKNKLFVIDQLRWISILKFMMDLTMYAINFEEQPNFQLHAVWYKSLNAFHMEIVSFLY